MKLGMDSATASYFALFEVINHTFGAYTCGIECVCRCFSCRTMSSDRCDGSSFTIIRITFCAQHCSHHISKAGPVQGCARHELNRNDSEAVLFSTQLVSRTFNMKFTATRRDGMLLYDTGMLLHDMITSSSLTGSHIFTLLRRQVMVGFTFLFLRCSLTGVT